ncbi:MAG: hypothetical protein DRN17_00290 [Thermoplasmata archaeon]|nr:MAG: hypothetical protein DRN17_00290 [Thermoplasmata archaeon]
MKLFKNKETKKKTTRRRKKKTFFQEHPFISYTMIFIAILAGLNYAMLTPPLIASIFYEIEHTVIRLLILPIPLQRWELILITLVTAMIGYFVFPTVWSPSENLSLTYRKVRYGEGLVYFTTFFGEEHGFPEELVEKRFMKYVIVGDVRYTGDIDGVKMHEGKKREATKRLIEQDFLDSILDSLENRNYDIAQGKIISPELHDALIAFLTSYRHKEGEK